MSTAELETSLKALGLGPSQAPSDTEASTVKKQIIAGAKRVSEPRRQRQPHVPVDKSSAAQTHKRQDKPEAERSILPAVPEPGRSVVPPNLPQTPSKKQRPRNRKGKSKGTKIQVSITQQPDPPASQPSDSTFVYVVQVAESRGIEKIIGVFTNLKEANERVVQYATKYGISRKDIKDIVSSFGGGGGPKPGNARAIRRTWPNGTSEVRVMDSDTLQWLKVLPKQLATSIADDDGSTKNVYLALDAGSIGMFVIGVFGDKEAAWEACRKYWTSLAYSSPVENKEQWFDARGMLHARGNIGGRGHHWFVEPYTIGSTGKEESTSKPRGKSSSRSRADD